MVSLFATCGKKVLIQAPFRLQYHIKSIFALISLLCECPTYIPMQVLKGYLSLKHISVTCFASEVQNRVSWLAILRKMLIKVVSYPGYGNCRCCISIVNCDRWWHPPLAWPWYTVNLKGSTSSFEFSCILWLLCLLMDIFDLICPLLVAMWTMFSMILSSTTLLVCLEGCQGHASCLEC